MRLLILALVAITTSCSAADKPADSVSADTTAATPAPSPAAPLTVTERGIGALMAGMSLNEANAALSNALVVPAGGDTASCGYVQWSGGPPGVDIMTEAGRIARIEVDSGSITTAEGAKIGDTEAHLGTLYKARIATTPHKYTDGHYLTVTPVAPADSAYRIVFETDGKVVTRYRAGRRPAVEYVEGCS